jgi:hypothetical protein
MSSDADESQPDGPITMLRCPECDTTNACVRELPDQGRPTVRRTGPDWLIRLAGASG